MKNPEKCECEHISHFDDGVCHKYGILVAQAIRDVLNGNLNICRDCFKNHRYNNTPIQKDDRDIEDMFLWDEFDS